MFALSRSGIVLRRNMAKLQQFGTARLHVRLKDWCCCGSHRSRSEIGRDAEQHQHHRARRGRGKRNVFRISKHVEDAGEEGRRQLFAWRGMCAFERRVAVPGFPTRSSRASDPLPLSPDSITRSEIRVSKRIENQQGN